MPLTGQNWYIWLTDPRFKGLPIYEWPERIKWWYFVVGAFLFLFIIIGLALLQDYRDDLFGYSLETGFNYSALEGVLPEIAGPYTLMVGEMNEAGSSFTAVAHFDNGAWINCFVNVEYINASYLNFCADTSLPYTAGFTHLLTGRPIPETCRNCAVKVDVAWQTWLTNRAGRLTDSPPIEFVAQQGGYVLMRAAAPDRKYAIECMFKGIKEVSLVYCYESES